MTLNQTTLGRFHSHVNSTINQSNLLDESNILDKSEISRGPNNAIKGVKDLYCNKKYSRMQFKLKLLFLSVCFNYYFVLFNIGALEGNIFTVGILFGLSEVLGILFGEPLIKHLPDWMGTMMSIIISLISTCMI
jgi:hypothetical protein